MSLTEKQITLQECLEYNGLTELPDVWNPADGQLLKGMALVRKHGGRESYVSVAGDGKGGVRIIRDSGTSATVVEFIEIYQIEVLDKKHIVKCRDDKDYLNFLVKSNGFGEDHINGLLESRDYAILDRLVEEASMKMAEKALSEEKRCRDIIQYAEKAKKSGKQGKTTKSRISYGKNRRTSDD